MNDDFLDDAPPAGTPSTRHALLVAALLHLMSQYTLRGAGRGTRNDDDTEGPCVKLAAVIERHLDALARLPDAEPVLRATCEQLRVKWEDLVDSRLPPPGKRPLFARLFRPGTVKPRALGA
ncbi:MAG: hypothetical protein WCC39_00100 [Telluria sp.]